MPLDPQARKFLEMLGDPPPLDTISPEQNRAAMAAAISLTGPRRTGRRLGPEDRNRDRAGTRTRVYRPDLAVGLPATTYFHGGWVARYLESHDTVCRDITAASGIAVVTVDYRLAPEHPYPAALDDCLGVTKRLTGNNNLSRRA
jgi:acetyl esterase